ncbi:aldolase, partial [Candidatus Woesebacteria bacterium]|nr:aldolase [Candidatus Woesebacteria bacterium]
MNHPIPADVAQDMRTTYAQNIETSTKGTGRLFLFAGDQKVEHMNDDFFGEGIAAEDATPEHLFAIASKAKIGAFATQLGLIAKYGSDFSNIPFIVKLNSKSSLVSTSQKDPYSATWTSLDAVSRFQKSSGLQVVGVGYTMYPGSEYEPQMLAEAAKIVFEAHQRGL